MTSKPAGFSVELQAGVWKVLTHISGPGLHVFECTGEIEIAFDSEAPFPAAQGMSFKDDDGQFTKLRFRSPINQIVRFTRSGGVSDNRAQPVSVSGSFNLDAATITALQTLNGISTGAANAVREKTLATATVAALKDKTGDGITTAAATTLTAAIVAALNDPAVQTTIQNTIRAALDSAPITTTT